MTDIIESGSKIIDVEARVEINIPELENKASEFVKTDSDVMDIVKGTNTLKKKCELIEITDAEWDEKATEYFKPIKDGLKGLEEFRKKYTQPFDKINKAINKQVRVYSEPLKECEQIIKDKKRDYFLLQEKIERKKQIEYEKKMEKSLADNKPMPAPPVQIAEKQTKTNNVTSSVLKVWKFKIQDVNSIPRDYMMVDESKIRNIIKAGVREIPGVFIYEDVDIRART